MIRKIIGKLVFPKKVLNKTLFNLSKNSFNVKNNLPNSVFPPKSDPPKTEKNNEVIIPSDLKIQTKPKSLETLNQENCKLEILSSEKHKVQEKYIVFSSKNAILPHIRIEGVFTTGKLNYEDLRHKIAFFMQTEDGKIFRTGVVFEKNLNKKFMNHLQVAKEKKSKKLDDGLFTGQLRTDVISKPKNYRIKIVEYESNPNGIFVKAIKIKDKQKKKIDKIRKEIKKTFEVISEIVAIDFKGKPELFDEKYYKKLKDQNIDELDYVKLDEMLYNIASVLLSSEQFLNEKANIIYQKLLEKRGLLDRVKLLNKILEELKKNITYHKQVSSFIANPKHDKILTKNKFSIAQDYIKAVFGLETKENSGGGVSLKEGVGMSSSQKIVKNYTDKLALIEDKSSKEKVKREIERLASMDKQTSEYSKILTYLDEVFSLPWNKYTQPYWNIHETKEILENEIYGLQKVKDRIIEMIAINKLKGENKNNKGFIILLYGPPGTGKTSVAKAIAKSLKRPHRFISFAGVNDPHFIKGHSRTYLDSQPGVFIKELIKAQSMNPIFILDEIDKLSRNKFGADPYYSLMEILNPEENSNFVDHYLDIKVDFSQVIFILTANDILHMLEPLKNRLEIIEIPPYIQQEKLSIAQKYLIPKLTNTYQFTQNAIKFENEDLLKIINGWCYHEGGVRELNRCLDKIYRKFSLEMVRKNVTPQSIELEGSNFGLNNKTLDHTPVLKKLLGPPYFNLEFEERSKKNFVPGVVNVLTVAGFVGEVLTVECVLDLSQPEKTGNFTYSGNLKNVIQESVVIAKINAFNFLNDEQIKTISEKNIHIHFTNGAAKKDGPSAGLSICTAYLSLALNKPIPANIAMTGELSTLGEVCKIGGLQSKLIAAKSLNIYDVIVPYGNLSEAQEFPELLTNGTTLYFVKEYKAIYNLLFSDNEDKNKDILIMKDGKIINNEINQVEIKI